jgi:hypothetical protein
MGIIIMSFSNVGFNMGIIIMSFSNVALGHGHICLVRVIVFNATFNNISVISWWSALLVEETTYQPEVTDELYQMMLY